MGAGREWRGTAGGEVRSRDEPLGHSEPFGAWGPVGTLPEYRRSKPVDVCRVVDENKGSLFYLKSKIKLKKS